MVGRTNASAGSGGGSAFLAYLQVATDPNAVITAVNLAGDTFSGTADSSGSLVLSITASGTYTVTETDGGVETIVIADNGETYTLSVIAFNGEVIINGEAVAIMSALAHDYSNSFGSWTGIVPTISYAGSGQDCVLNVTVGQAERSGVYVTNYVDISSYTYMRFRYKTSRYNGSVRVIAIDEQAQIIEISGATAETNLYVETFNFPSTIDKTKKYRLGVLVYGGATFYINNLIVG